MNDIVKSILITGATGFLGVHLVNELMVDESIELYCLIRSKTIDDAKNKLKKSFEKWQCEVSPNIYRRIHIVLGDLNSNE